MGVHFNPIRHIAWEMLGFSRFFLNHPVFPLFSFLLLLLFYIFLPSVFFMCLYVSPIPLLAAVFVRYYLKPRTQSTQKKKDEKASFQGSNPAKCFENSKPYLRSQRSVRRNAQRNIAEEMVEVPDYPGDEKDKVILTMLFNDMLGREPHFEETPKAPNSASIEDADENSSTEVLKGFTGGREAMEEYKEKKNGSDDDDDDGNNSMDLGISEMERSRRLESLMARRRARKPLHWSAEKAILRAAQSTSKYQVPPVFVPRSEYEVDGLLLPGSAPSRLLEVHNPFDLPYDPNEEKPDLMGDNFHQEFAILCQKDKLYTRHASFRRAFFPAMQYMDFEAHRETIQGSQSSTLNQNSGDNEHRPAEQDCRLPEETAKGKIEDVHREAQEESDPSSLVSTQIEQAATLERKSSNDWRLSSHVKENQRSSEQSLEKKHSLALSLDSDLHVEVSDIGSPPTTVDENDPASDEENFWLTCNESHLKHLNQDQATTSHQPEEPVNDGDHGSSKENMGQEEMKIALGSHPETLVTEPKRMLVEEDTSREMGENLADKTETDPSPDQLSNEQQDESVGGAVVPEAIENSDPPTYSPTSSPRSVLVGKLSLDQTYSLTSEDWEHVVAPYHDTDNPVREQNAITDDQRHLEASIEHPPTNALLEETYAIVEETHADATMVLEENAQLLHSNSDAAEDNKLEEEDGDSAGKVAEKNVDVTEITNHLPISDDLQQVAGTEQDKKEIEEQANDFGTAAWENRDSIVGNGDMNPYAGPHTALREE